MTDNLANLRILSTTSMCGPLFVLKSRVQSIPDLDEANLLSLRVKYNPIHS